MLTNQYQDLKSCKKIGLFDSGIGGLSVLRKLTNLSYGSADRRPPGKPSNRGFVYLGDTARCPYGARPPAEINSFVTEIIDWLVRQDVDGILIACNTSTALALELARRVSPVPVFDIIQPTAQYVASLDKKIAVLSTTSTSTSRAYSIAIAAINPNIDVIEIGCPDLVPLVETGRIFDRSTKNALEPYVEASIGEGATALVLGCTHFPFLIQPLQELVGDRITIIDPAEVLADLLGTSSNSSISDPNLTDECSIFVTGDYRQFEQAAALCLGHPLCTTGMVTVAELGTPVALQESSKATTTPFSSNEKRTSINVTSDNLVAATSAGNS